jgi:hypothetical protein
LINLSILNFWLNTGWTENSSLSLMQFRGCRDEHSEDCYFEMELKTNFCYFF